MERMNRQLWIERGAFLVRLAIMLYLLLCDFIHPGKEPRFFRFVAVNLLPDLHENFYECIFGNCFVP